MSSEQQGDTRSVRHAIVRTEDSGQRLDNYLLRELKGVPRTRLYRAMRTGEVRVNKARVRADYRLVEGDVVRIPPLRLPHPTSQPTVPQTRLRELSGRILYEDDRLLAINKPSGLAVHGGSGLNFGLIESLRQLRPEAGFLELVHRLDRDTSGVILIAKRPSLLRELHARLREKSVEKAYVLLVAGHWPESRRVVEAPLQKSVLVSGERLVRVSTDGKPSVTEFSVVTRFKQATLLEARPITGRTHQIRVHARHLGFPLVGDEKYGNTACEELARSIGLKRLFLHASRVRIAGEDGTELVIEAPIEPELTAALRKLSE